MNHEIGLMMESLSALLRSLEILLVAYVLTFFPLKYVSSYFSEYTCTHFTETMFCYLYTSRATFEAMRSFHQFVNGCIWPKKISAASMTGRRLFEKRNASSGELKASASELLSVYGVVRLAVITKFPDVGLLPSQPSLAVRSFLAACQVLDVLKKSMSEEICSNQLKAAVTIHQQLRLAAHGATNYQPKMHYSGHFYQHVESHPKLLSCFCHERKHKQIKRFANAHTNHSQAFEKSLLEEVVLLQSTALKEDQTKQSFALVSPKPASSVLAEHVKLFLGLGASDPLDVFASHDAVPQAHRTLFCKWCSHCKNNRWPRNSRHGVVSRRSQWEPLNGLDSMASNWWFSQHFQSQGRSRIHWN